MSANQRTDATNGIDVDALREQVKSKYRHVAANPGARHHFHTGRPLAARLGYPDGLVEGFPDAAVEAFAGVGNPFSLRSLEPGERVVDVGSGAGFDSLVAAKTVGPAGAVVGVDMTEEMLAKSRMNAAAMGLDNVEFRQGLAEAIPVEDEWADVVISNGVINLCPDKETVIAEAYRVLKPGGRLQVADIVVAKKVPRSAKEDISLWTG